jgi:hypothetical protein
MIINRVCTGFQNKKSKESEMIQKHLNECHCDVKKDRDFELTGMVSISCQGMNWTTQLKNKWSTKDILYVHTYIKCRCTHIFLCLQKERQAQRKKLEDNKGYSFNWTLKERMFLQTSCCKNQYVRSRRIVCWHFVLKSQCSCNRLKKKFFLVKNIWSTKTWFSFKN